jgi:phosphate transport system protein
MTRLTLDLKIKQLLEGIQKMQCMVDDATRGAIESLESHDVNRAREIYCGDEAINQLRFEMEQNPIITIATQQPIVATDLRLMASILEIVGELERMGDYAKGIAKICIQIGDEPHIKPLIDIPKMADHVISMLNRAVDAFVNQDAEAAIPIPDEDDEVDYLYQQVYQELVQIMMKDQSTMDQANLLLWAAHNLERMADRVTNICERTIYTSTGKLEEMDVSDDESRFGNK